MAWVFAIGIVFCVSCCQRYSKERSNGLGKITMKKAFVLANFFLLCFVFKAVSYERGKLFGHKTQLSPIKT